MKTAKHHGALIRPLEGYRAIAIITVLLFHLDFTFAKAGFLGVDIFFVISGFIITRNIHSQITQNRFSLPRFYFKRYRRLFPALLVTVIATIIGGFFILEVESYKKLGDSALFSILSVANINFWMEAGYFDDASDAKPLLHMWSLSVEEQFYLFWPAILLFLGTAKVFKSLNPTKIIVLLFLLSFGATICASTISPSTAFYWFPFRVFQFMSGAIFAVVAVKLKSLNLMNALNLLGFVVFLLSCCLLSNTTNIAFAGTIAALSGALLILTIESSVAHKIFGNKLMVFIGQHSYSMYLVHWPVIVLYKASNGGDLVLLEQISLGAVSIVLAVLLRRLVEQPLRVVTAHEDKRKLFATSLTTLFLALGISLSSIVWIYKGLPSRFSSELAGLMVVDDSYQTKMRYGDCFLSKLKHSISDLKPFCYKSEKSERNLLIIGSSLAADTYYGINNYLSGWKIYQVTASSCPPLLAIRKISLCADTHDFIFNKILLQEDYNLVVLSGIGPNANVSTTVEFFEKNNIDYVILGPRPSFVEVPSTLVKQHGKIDGLDDWMNSNMKPHNEIKHQLEDRHYFSIYKNLCPSANIDCKWRDGKNSFYRDQAHFSPTGSNYIGKKFSEWLESRE